MGKSSSSSSSSGGKHNPEKHRKKMEKKYMKMVKKGKIRQGEPMPGYPNYFGPGSYAAGGAMPFAGAGQPGYPAYPSCQPGAYPPGGVPPQGYPTGVPPQGYPAGVPPQGYPAGVPPQGYPAGVPPQGYPAGIPPQGYPAGVPPQGYPAGVPPQGYPAGVPPQGYPAGVPQQGYAAGVPPQGYPAQPGHQGFPPQTGVAPAPGTQPQGYSGPPAQQGYVGVPGGPGGAPAVQQPAQPQVTGNLYPAQPAVPGPAPVQPGAVPVPGMNQLAGDMAAMKVHGVAERFFGTVFPANPFNAESDCQALRAAMKGAGTDEAAIVNIVTRRSNIQRVQIRELYKTCYGRDLIEDLKSDLSGDFEELVLALFMPPAYYDAWSLRKALQGVGTKERWLIEILCTRTNAQIHEIKRTYKEHFHRDLEKDVVSDTSGHFKKLLVSCLQGNRTELTTDQWHLLTQQGPEAIINRAQAQQDAQALHQAGVKKLGTDESTFIRIMAVREYYQLRATFEEYNKLSGKDFTSAIKGEFSGDVEQAFLALVNSARDRPGYFAEELYSAMRGAGTRDSTLIRIVVSRSEIDLGNIKQSYQSKYGKSLSSAISDDTSGDYRRTLTALIGQ